MCSSEGKRPKVPRLKLKRKTASKSQAVARRHARGLAPTVAMAVSWSSRDSRYVGAGARHHVSTKRNWDVIQLSLWYSCLVSSVTCCSTVKSCLCRGVAARTQANDGSLTGCTGANLVQLLITAPDRATLTLSMSPSRGCVAVNSRAMEWERPPWRPRRASGDE